MYEQAERLIPSLTPDERRRLIAALLGEVPTNKFEKAPELRLEPAASGSRSRCCSKIAANSIRRPCKRLAFVLF